MDKQIRYLLIIMLALILLLVATLFINKAHGQDTLKVEVQDSILIKLCFDESILWIIPIKECRIVSREALYEFAVKFGLPEPVPKLDESHSGLKPVPQE